MTNFMGSVGGGFSEPATVSLRFPRFIQGEPFPDWARHSYGEMSSRLTWRIPVKNPPLTIQISAEFRRFVLPPKTRGFGGP